MSKYSIERMVFIHQQSCYRDQQEVICSYHIEDSVHCNIVNFIKGFNLEGILILIIILTHLTYPSTPQPNM